MFVIHEKNYSLKNNFVIERAISFLQKWKTMLKHKIFQFEEVCLNPRIRILIRQSM